MVIKDPCVLCKKFVAKSHRALRCDICLGWVHIRCNSVSPATYFEYMDNENDPTIPVKDNWYCIKCINSNISFSDLDDKHFYITLNGINSDNDLSNINFSLNPSDKKITESISKIIIENTDLNNQNIHFCTRE